MRFGVEGTRVMIWNDGVRDLFRSRTGHGCSHGSNDDFKGRGFGKEMKNEAVFQFGESQPLQYGEPLSCLLQ